MEKVNISLAGCGFLGIYHVGVASCFKEYAPHLLLNKISGASIGALAGCCLLTDVSLGIFTSEMLHIIYEIRRRPLGPFNPLVNVQAMLRNILVKELPKNAYEIVSGRIFVSMTRVHDGSNCIVSEFKSNEELIEVLLASAFVPLFSGFIPPKLGEYRYIDGGFSNNLPILDENTITVSPFCGESDICPRDSSVQLFHVNLCNTSVEVSRPNIYRFARILFPPSAEVLSQMCKQGFDDALKFLQRNDMISCTKCLTVQRTISLPMSKHKRKSDPHDPYDPQCEQCVHHIKEAASSKLPEPVLKNFETSIEIANKEFTSWIFKHKSLRIVSVISLPYFFTADLIIAILRKFAEIAPEVMDRTSEYSKQWLQLFIETVNKMNKAGLFMASKVFGPQAISVYINEKRNIARPKEIIPRKETNLQYNFDPNIVINTLESNVGKHEESFVLKAAELTTAHDDTYDNLLQAIDHHEALMAFYYMDDSNKMNVVEFFDVTHDQADENHDDDSKITSKDIACDDWQSTQNNGLSHAINSSEDDENSVCSTTDMNDQLNASSDPESEWARTNDSLILDNQNPESEQRFKKKSVAKSMVAFS